MFDIWCMVVGILGCIRYSQVPITAYEEKDVLSQQNNDVIEEQPCLTRFRIVT